jgi:hypothetical protein
MAAAQLVAEPFPQLVRRAPERVHHERDRRRQLAVGGRRGALRARLEVSEGGDAQESSDGR